MKRKTFDSVAFKRHLLEAGLTSVEEGDDNFESCILRKQYACDKIVWKQDEESGGEESRTLSFTISTGAPDRHNDTVAPKGFDLKPFKKNPVVLFAHRAGDPPIAKSPPKSVRVENDRLKADATFMPPEMDEFRGGFSDSIFRMLKGGFLNATSVGFIPSQFDFRQDDEGNFVGVDFKKQELLEFSVVPVPANPEALIEARSAGIDMAPYFEWVEEALDEWADWKGVLMVPKKQMEVLLREAGGKTETGFLLPLRNEDDLRRANLALVTGQAFLAGKEVENAFNGPPISAPFGVIPKLGDGVSAPTVTAGPESVNQPTPPAPVKEPGDEPAPVEAAPAKDGGFLIPDDVADGVRKFLEENDVARTIVTLDLSDPFARSFDFIEVGALSFKDALDMEIKAGRVLSRANESRLRDAVELLVQVLDALPSEDDDADDKAKAVDPDQIDIEDAIKSLGGDDEIDLSRIDFDS